MHPGARLGRVVGVGVDRVVRGSNGGSGGGRRGGCCLRVLHLKSIHREVYGKSSKFQNRDWPHKRDFPIKYLNKKDTSVRPEPITGQTKIFVLHDTNYCSSTFL